MQIYPPPPEPPTDWDKVIADCLVYGSLIWAGITVAYFLWS